MSVIDEIQVTDAGGVEVRLVVPDEVSTEPDILMTFSLCSETGQYIFHHCLEAMPRRLGLRGQVKSIVHGGGDCYTVHTPAGEHEEFDRTVAADLVDALDELAKVLEGTVRNGASAGAQSTRAK